MFVSPSCPVGIEDVGSTRVSLFLFQTRHQFLVISGHPTLCHFQKPLTFLLKIWLLQSRRLRAEHPSTYWVINEHVSGVRVCCEKFVEISITGLSLLRKLFADVIDQVVGLLINLLLRNSKNLAEVALDRCRHHLIALDMFQVVHTEQNQHR